MKDLTRLLYKLHKGSLVFNYGEKIASTKPADLIRVLSEWSQRDVVDMTIRNIIVDTILSSENKQIGSGIICALTLLSDDNFCDDIQKYRHRAEVTDLDATIKYFLGNGMLSKLTRSALEMGALGGNIRFSLSNSSNFILESSNTFNIEGHIHPLFESDMRWFELPHIICIDGIIESLGEIDSLLQEAAEIKNNIIICASGYHHDVVHTLSENWKLQRLKVVPFIVRRWSSDEKSAPEVCDKMGLVCVSRDKGDILASKKLEYFSTVKSAYLSARDIAIQNDTGESVHLDIRIPKTMRDLAGIIEDRIRVTLQACVGVAQWGILKNHRIFEVSNNLGINQPEVSVNTIVIGIRSAQTCKEIIKKLGAAIVPDIN
jgi:hypothetical protein